MQRLWRELLVAAGAAVGAALPIERAAAQEYLSSLNYSIGLPSGDTKDFTDNESWLGLTFEGQWFVRPNASAGILFGWNEFYKQEQDAQFTFDNGTITGRQYRHLNIFPMLVTGKYYLSGEHESIGSTMSPFVGLSTGAYYVRQLFDLGSSEVTSDNWLFGVAPEVGVLLPLRGGTLASLNVRYHYPFSSGDWLGGEARSWQYWTFGVGVAYGGH